MNNLTAIIYNETAIANYLNNEALSACLTDVDSNYVAEVKYDEGIIVDVIGFYCVVGSAELTYGDYAAAEKQYNHLVDIGDIDEEVN